MTILGLFVATLLLSPVLGSRRTARQQTQLSVGTVCADVPVPMDKEISGHRIERRASAHPSISKGGNNDNAG